MQTAPLRTCWVVTWEWMGNHARVEEDKKVVAILNYRWPAGRVRDLVEQLYASISYGPWDKVRVARNRRSNPYPAEFRRIRGVPWEGQILCGDNPWLYARRVRNLKAVAPRQGTSHAIWEEIPRLVGPPRAEPAR